MSDHVAHAETEISASPQQVWDALTDPEAISSFMFGSKVDTDWEEGSPITWSGEYDGKSYQDKGEVLEVEPEKRLVVTHFSPMTGQADVPENYHRVTYRLEDEGDRTQVTLEQDNTPAGSEEEFRTNWETMLGNLKELVESGRRGME